MGYASIGRADEICRVRRAVTGNFIINGLMTYYSEYIHAMRDMAAHLTRQMCT